MLKRLSFVLAAVAGFGWLLSIVVSVAPLFGTSVSESISGKLFIGMFPLQVFAILFMQRVTRHSLPKDLWKSALRGCPQWLRYAIWGAWGYAALMVLFMALRGSGGLDLEVGAGFIGMFYAMQLGIFVTGATTDSEPAKCSNGHEMGPFANYCSECGKPALRAPDRSSP